MTDYTMRAFRRHKEMDRRRPPVADDVLTPEQVARYSALDKRWLPDYWQDVVDLRRSHEALRAQLTAEQSSRMAAECDLVDTRQQVEALRGRLEDAEHAVAVMTPEGFSEAMRVAIEDRERAEAALGRALWLLDELQWSGPDGSCPCCGARPALHDDTCRLVQMTGWPASAAALTRLQRLEHCAYVLRCLESPVCNDGYCVECQRPHGSPHYAGCTIGEALAALDEGEAQP